MIQRQHNISHVATVTSKFLNDYFYLSEGEYLLCKGGNGRKNRRLELSPHLFEKIHRWLHYCASLQYHAADILFGGFQNSKGLLHGHGSSLRVPHKKHAFIPERELIFLYEIVDDRSSVVGGPVKRIYVDFGGFVRL